MPAPRTAITLDAASHAVASRPPAEQPRPVARPAAGRAARPGRLRTVAAGLAVVVATIVVAAVTPAPDRAAGTHAAPHAPRGAHPAHGR